MYSEATSWQLMIRIVVRWIRYRQKRAVTVVPLPKDESSIPYEAEPALYIWPYPLNGYETGLRSLCRHRVRPILTKAEMAVSSNGEQIINDSFWIKLIQPESDTQLVFHKISIK